MPRLAPSMLSLARLARPSSSRTFVTSRALFAPENDKSTAKNQSHSGWEGRPTEEHAVNRTDELDVQSQAAQSGMRQHEKGEEGSQAISRKDEGNNNKRAKEDHPEAPGPVLGMNDERGGKGH